MSFVAVQSSLDDISAAIAGTILATGKAGLFTNNPSLSENTLLSDLTEAVFTGYGQVALTISLPYKDASGNIVVKADADFAPSATLGTPVQITGWFVTDGAVTPKLKYAGYLPSGSATLATALDLVAVVLEFFAPQDGNWGNVVEISPTPS